MSGGGSGPGSRHSKAKYRSEQVRILVQGPAVDASRLIDHACPLVAIPCKDFSAGCCLYGDYCSFLHEGSPLPVDNEDKTPQQEIDQKTAMEGSDVVEDQNAATTTTQILVEPKPPKLAKFNKGDISIPDYRWGEGTKPIVTWPTTATRANFLREQSGVDWSTEPSPMAASFPVFSSVNNLDVPPTAGIPASGDSSSPFLPISAYTFSTDSAPITPASVGDPRSPKNMAPPSQGIHHHQNFVPAAYPVYAFTGPPYPMNDIATVYLYNGMNPLMAEQEKTNYRGEFWY